MQKNCPKCNSIFDSYSKWGEKKFCSKSCANSRTFNDESKRKKSLALKGRSFGKPNIKNPDKWIQKIKDTALQKYLKTPFDELGSENRRRRVFEEQNHKCANCGLEEWMGHKISLELDHKDGDNTNNTRENLEGLCPNCHSITDTWRGRNKLARNGKTCNKITDEELLSFLKSSDNIRQALLKAGISPKGKNYIRAKKLLGRIEKQ